MRVPGEERGSSGSGRAYAAGVLAEHGVQSSEDLEQYLAGDARELNALEAYAWTETVRRAGQRRSKRRAGEKLLLARAARRWFQPVPEAERPRGEDVLAVLADALEDEDGRREVLLGWAALRALEEVGALTGEQTPEGTLPGVKVTVGDQTLNVQLAEVPDDTVVLGGKVHVVAPRGLGLSPAGEEVYTRLRVDGAPPERARELAAALTGEA